MSDLGNVGAYEWCEAYRRALAENDHLRAEILDIKQEAIQHIAARQASARQDAETIARLREALRSLVGMVGGSGERSMSVEVRKNDDGSIDEVIAKGCAIHLEQMHKNAWYLGIDAKDGSHWQFWLGAKNGNCHVVVRHTEMTPTEDGQGSGEDDDEITRLRAALAEAEKKMAVLEDSESCEAITLRTKLAEAERALAQWNDTAGERGLSDPEEMAFQLDGDGRQIKSLKATLVEAERECRQVRETNSEWRQHCQQYEADLAEARKVIIACANQDNGETARSFLERTVDAGEKP